MGFNPPRQSEVAARTRLVMLYSVPEYGLCVKNPYCGAVKTANILFYGV